MQGQVGSAQLGEIEIICPKCKNLSNRGNFKSQVCYVNVLKGVWHCYRCSAAGTVNSLDEESKRLLGLVSVKSDSSEVNWTELAEAYEMELSEGESERAVDYLAVRFNVNDEDELLKIAKQFKLGYDSGRDRISIPVFKEGHIVGLKFRSISEDLLPKYIAESGTLSGVYELEGDPSNILICEGEFDAICARLMGFQGRILATQTNRIQNHVRGYYEQAVEQAQKVIVSLDSDDAGQELGRFLSEMIPLSKLAQLDMPKDVKDIADFCLAGRGPEFPGLVSGAKTGMEQLTYNVLDKVQESLDFMQNRKNITGWSTGFRLLDDKLGGGLLPYTLTAISAPGKTGKTTFTIQLIHNLLVSGVKVGFMSLEMNPSTHVIPSLFSIISRRNIRKLSGEDLNEAVGDCIDNFPNLKNLFFMDRYGSTPADMLRDWIMHQYKVNGVEVFFLDHVGYSLADIKDSNEHSRLSKMLRGLTRELPIHIVAIVQPRNLQFGQTRVTKADLYGSITWSQDLNALITLERLQDGALGVRLTDSHNPLSKPGDDALILYYDYESCSLS